MTWLQILAQAAIFATFIGAFTTIAAYFNGKHIKEGVGGIGEMIKETRNLIVTEQMENRKLMEKMESNTIKILDKIYDKVA